jgi:endonuclease YncB( thermonuclease family)
MRTSLLLAMLLGAMANAAFSQQAATPAAADQAPPPAQRPDAVPEPGDLPTVKIRSIDNGDTVEEYRVNGRLSMVKVRPRSGVPYLLIDANGDGRLDRKDSEGPVAPVYWTLYEWD